MTSKSITITKKTIQPKTTKVTAKETSAIEILSAIKMASSEESKQAYIEAMSAEQIMALIDFAAPSVEEMVALETKLKALEKSVKESKAIILEALKAKKQRNVVTPSGNVVEAKKGRAVTVPTVTVYEFIKLAEDAGHSDVIDKMVSIKITEAKTYLGESLLNRMTEKKVEEWGGINFSKI